MAEHSKWANIKHRKAKQDSTRDKIFTKIGKELIMAAKSGGGDPEINPRLKVVIAKAREVNMPNDNIFGVIQKATGELADVNYEELVYEGYGPGGVAVLLNIITDNHNRTAGEIRHLFSKNGGSLGETGCVAWMFDQKGMIVFDKEELQVDDDEIMWRALDLGAEDVRMEDEVIEIITTPEDYEQVKEGFKEHGLTYSYAELTMMPQTTIRFEEKEAVQMIKLIDALEDHDDVLDVWANHEIDEDIE